jgi:hypothetical protein
MLAKLLLTLAVILVALVYLQKRRIAELASRTTGKTKPAQPGPTRSTAQTVKPQKPEAGDYRIAAWLFLALMIGAASTVYVLGWQEANKEISVLLHRDSNTDPVVYQVLKKNLSQRSFTTIDGVLVTVSANERMEVIGL